MSQSHADATGQLRIVGVSILVLAVIGVVLLGRHWPFSRQRVTEALQDDFHGTVTLEAAGLNPFS